MEVSNAGTGCLGFRTMGDRSTKPFMICLMVETDGLLIGWFCFAVMLINSSSMSSTKQSWITVAICLPCFGPYHCFVMICYRCMAYGAYNIYRTMQLEQVHPQRLFSDAHGTLMVDCILLNKTTFTGRRSCSFFFIRKHDSTPCKILKISFLPNRIGCHPDSHPGVEGSEAIWYDPEDKMFVECHDTRPIPWTGNFCKYLWEHVGLLLVIIPLLVCIDPDIHPSGCLKGTFHCPVVGWSKPKPCVSHCANSNQIKKQKKFCFYIFCFFLFSFLYYFVFSYLLLLLFIYHYFSTSLSSLAMGIFVNLELPLNTPHFSWIMPFWTFEIWTLWELNLWLLKYETRTLTILLDPHPEDVGVIYPFMVFKRRNVLWASCAWRPLQIAQGNSCLKHCRVSTQSVSSSTNTNHRYCILGCDIQIIQDLCMIWNWEQYWWRMHCQGWPIFVSCSGHFCAFCSVCVLCCWVVPVCLPVSHCTKRHAFVSCTGYSVWIPHS